MHAQYFCNEKCEYYPCHSMEGKLNCLFCYCPLYQKEKCPGTPSYIVTSDGSRIKDCSNCVFPHIPGNYDKVVSAVSASMDTNEIVSLRTSELHEKAYEYLSSYAGFSKLEQDGKTEELRMQESEAKMVYQNEFAKSFLHIGIRPFDRSCVQDGYFQFGDQKIDCTVLHRIAKSNVLGGYFAAFHAPINEKMEQSLLSQYYIENWQNALLDACRDWTRDYIQRRESVRSPRYVTDSFGPGFYGMSIDYLADFVALSNAGAAGITLSKEGHMLPAKSIVAIYLVLQKPLDFVIEDCSSCIGGETGCGNCGRVGRTGTCK